MRYPHIWQALTATPWAIEVSKLHAIIRVVARREAGEDMDPDEIRAIVGAAQQQAQPRAGNGIAVLPIFGTLVQRASMLEQSSGAVSCEQIGAMFAQALADPSIGTVVLNIDSPGGNVSGIPELGDQIARGAKQKRVVAVANSLAASAAYWLGSQAESLYVTPSGMVGSIGIIAAHEDVSGALAKEGIAVSLITAGKYKGEMNPFMPLSEEARAATQAMCDRFYGMFTQAVARGRGTTPAAVAGGMGEGRVVAATDAVRLGMVDGVKTLDQVLAGLANGRLARPQRAAALAAGWEPLVIDGARDGLGVVMAVSPPGVRPLALNIMDDTDLDYVAGGQVFLGVAPPLAAGPIAPHKTDTSDAPWDGPENEKRLPSPMPMDTAGNAYAYVDETMAEDGMCPKAAGRFIHHFISVDGEPGAASTVACSTGIGVLNGGRGGTVLEGADREGVYRHLSKHLSDAGQEAPPLKGSAALPSSSPDVAAAAQDRASSPTGPDLRRRRLRLHEAARR